MGRSHNRKLDLCRVHRGLPSGKTRALGKEPLCRAPNPALSKGRFAECLTLGKLRHSAKKFFAECRALGKHGHSAKSARGQTASMAVTFAECLPLGTRQTAATWQALGPPGRLDFAECHVAGTRQTTSLPSASPSTRQKIFFFGFGRQFFCEAFLQYHDQHIQIWHIFSIFCYIFHFISIC